MLPIPDGPFEAVELLSDPFVLVTAAGSPLAGIAGCRPIQLIGAQRLIGFRSCRSTRWVEEHLRAQGEEPNFVFRSEDNGTVQAMAGAGLGTALVPLLAVDTSDPSIVVLPTDLPPRRIALMWHRDRYRSPAASGVRGHRARGRRDGSRPSSRRPAAGRRLTARIRRSYPPVRPEPAGILRRCPTTSR